MYYNHNLDFLASAAMMSGQFAEAARAADELVANATPMIADMPMLEPFGAKTLYVLLRFARWDDVLRLPMPDAKRSLLTALWHFGRGVAQAALGNDGDAGARRTAYQAARKAIPPDSDWGYNKAKAVLVDQPTPCSTLDRAARQATKARRSRRGSGRWRRRTLSATTNRPTGSTRRGNRSARRTCKRGRTEDARSDISRGSRTQSRQPSFDVWPVADARGERSRRSGDARPQAAVHGRVDDADVELKLSDF